MAGVTHACWGRRRAVSQSVCRSGCWESCDRAPDGSCSVNVSVSSVDILHHEDFLLLLGHRFFDASP
ncbi:hypothetical protein J6590_023200 [Homalodisca vitripennis]|nr:hypothetical protein J6590_023200 [Homalodisca vitripennis]